MTTHRNDPCPCGSGKKYKRCCMASDQKMERTLHLVGNEEGHLRRRSDLAGLDIGTTWQAEIVPAVTRLESDPSARPALSLVVAGDIVLHADVLAHPPSEHADIAALLEGAVRSASDAARMAPAAVEVRFPEIARLLAERLAARGVAVREARQLAALDALADDFNAHMLRDSAHGRLRISCPDMWAGWGLAREQVARVFAEGASYYRAAPWRELANDQTLRAEVPDGGTWTITVLGNGGQEFGLSLYAEADDVRALLGVRRGAADGRLTTRGIVISLLLDRSDEVPRAMRREIREARWELAGTSAYPRMMALNTPAGGVTRRQADDLIALLHAVPRFVDQHRRALVGDEVPQLPLRWTDADTGVALQYEGFSPGVRGAALWGIPTALSPALPEGPGADPGAILGYDAESDALAKKEFDVVGLFYEYLQSAERSKPVSAATARKHARSAELLLDFLIGCHSAPVRAVTEYDLRVFLYDWVPQEVMPSRTEARSLPGSLRRFFAFLAEREGIVCPWAEPILRDTSVYEARLEAFPGGFSWNPRTDEWRGELYTNLHARVMLYEPGPVGGIGWGGALGPLAAELASELQRRWLQWRDQAIRAGITAPEAVRAAILPKQREWARTPNDTAGGATPSDAVAREYSTIAKTVEAAVERLGRD